jgi:hypothetical protein
VYVHPINNTDFRAKIVKEVPILKKTGCSGYKNASANLLEFDITNSADMEKIKEISKLPGFALYGYEIYQSLLPENNNSITKHCFALVNDSQMYSSKIDNDNVLGLFTFRERSEKEYPDEVALFITNQQFRTRWYRNERENKFLHVGEGMAEALKSIFPYKSIKCFSEAGAVNFWKKCGFKEIAERSLLLKR